MSGGPLLPSSVYFGGASGNAYPAYYTPTTNTNTAGFFEGVGLVASLGADAPVTLQFNMPKSIPTGTPTLRMLAMSTSTNGAQVVKLTISLNQVVLGVLTSSTIIAEAQQSVAGNAINDTDIDTQIAAMWNALAGA